jgi:hypothetical protein
MKHEKELYKLYFQTEIIIESDLSWEEKYDKIFSNEISRRVYSMTSHNWYDPDTTYEEDVMAFYNSFTEYLWG